MIWATVSSWSCFCWLYIASPSLATKNILNLILVLTIWYKCSIFSFVVGRECLLWPVHFQGKLEVVKQEMAKVDVDILGISKLRWTGMGEFNSDEHYIYCCGQESLRRNGVAIMVNRRVWNAVLGCNLKNDIMISVRFQGKQFNITVIRVYAPTSNA